MRLSLWQALVERAPPVAIPEGGSWTAQAMREAIQRDMDTLHIISELTPLAVPLLQRFQAKYGCRLGCGRHALIVLLLYVDINTVVVMYIFVLHWKRHWLRYYEYFGLHWKHQLFVFSYVYWCVAIDRRVEIVDSKSVCQSWRKMNYAYYVLLLFLCIIVAVSY